MIRIFVEQKPDGWHYEWADIPEQRESPTIPKEWAPTVAVYQGVHETFDKAVEAVSESVRSRYPRGELQGDKAPKGAG
jgi:hypothetical protein